MTSCSATTAKGTGCRAAAFASTWRWDDLRLTADVIPSAPAQCWQHLPARERELIALAEENRARQTRRALDEVSPACWSWSLPSPRELVDAHTADSAGSETLILWQAGQCATCGRPGPLVQDHDHETGLVRGWLCGACNAREGTWPDGDNLFGRYRLRPPTTILGLTLRYFNEYTGEWDQGRPPVDRSRRNAMRGVV